MALAFQIPNIAYNCQNLICIRKPRSGASRLVNTVGCWQDGAPRDGMKAPHPPNLVLCISSIWLFLKCIFYNKLVVEAESQTL